MALSSEAFVEMLGQVRAERAVLGRQADPFDVAVFGFGDPGGPGLVRSFADHGATWWLESLSPMRGSIETLLAVVQAGPPRVR